MRGHGEYLLNFEFGKMGMREGLMLRMRAEHRFGNTINAASGALLPPSILSDLPNEPRPRIWCSPKCS